MKKLLLLLLMSVTFANGDLMFNLFLSNNDGYNKYSYYNRYYPHHHHHHHNLIYKWMLMSYFTHNHNEKKVEKTDKQILDDLQKLYTLYEQGAITLKEYNEMKNMMLKELENN